MNSKINTCFKIYESNPTQSNNYYNSLEDEDDDKTVVISNTSCKNEATAILTNDLSFESKPRPTFFAMPAQAKPTNATFESKPVPIQTFTVPTLPTRNKAWTQTIAKFELRKSEHAETMFNTSKIKIAVDNAIADAGAKRVAVASISVSPVTSVPLAALMADASRSARTISMTFIISAVDKNNGGTLMETSIVVMKQSER